MPGQIGMPGRRQMDPSAPSPQNPTLPLPPSAPLPPLEGLEPDGGLHGYVDPPKPEGLEELPFTMQYHDPIESWEEYQQYLELQPSIPSTELGGGPTWMPPDPYSLPPEWRPPEKPPTLRSGFDRHRVLERAGVGRKTARATHARDQRNVEELFHQMITLGMTPHEARLAGGSFFYKVEADPKRWPRGSDPLTVIASQTDQADDSKITLTFRNRTQFQTPKPTTFRVEIRHGRVTEIVRVDK